MSFLDESSATLQEALAFIDAHESSSDSSSSADASAAKPHKLGYWERIRAEGDSLRMEATMLEQRLQQLQAQSVQHFDRQPWSLVGGDEGQAVVEQEYQRRLKAESTKQELKGLIAHNSNLMESLAGLSFQSDSGYTSILLNLINIAMRVESNAKAILDHAGLSHTDSFLFRAQRERDPQLGSVFESISSTPLAITPEQADNALWRRFLNDAEHSFGPPEITVIERGYTKAFPSTLQFAGECFKLTSHMVLRRHVYQHLVVYVWVASTAIPGTRVTLIEESVMSVRSPMQSSSPAATRKALFQCWLRIHSEQSDVSNSNSDVAKILDLELLIECALRKRSSFDASYIQSLEATLMNEPQSSID